jgi:FkbM family methyltransferase
MYGAYIGNDKMLIKTAWGMRLIASCSDMSLMPTLMVNGQIEEGLTNWLINNQEKFRDKIIIDVGANIGYFTVLFGCIVGETGKVVAYEANPRVFDMLKENIYLSQLHTRTTLINRAVSDKVGRLGFHVSTKYQGNSSLKEHGELYKTQFATDEFEEIEVIAEPISYFLGMEHDIELIKIDVEGAEYKVLLGAKDLLQSGKVKNVVFELNKNMLGDETEKLVELLKELKEGGALFYAFTQQGETIHVQLDDLLQHDYVDNILIRF